MYQFIVPDLANRQMVITIQSKLVEILGHQTCQILQRNVCKEGKFLPRSKHLFQTIVKFGKPHISMILQQILMKLPIFAKFSRVN